MRFCYLGIPILKPIYTLTSAMKKHATILILLLIALVVTEKSNAQIGAGAIAPNIVATDISGNNWNLYDLLDEGKTVFLDVFATWCGPCWNYHTSGALDDFYNQYGPNGTNEIMVFMIEGDGSTTLADLQGTGGNTAGNWISGTPMPIIDNSGIATDYQIRYFPTIFMICPDRIVREVGPLSTADLESVRAECSIATATHDAGITNSMMYLNGSPAGCGNLNINYRLANYGIDTLTSATIELLDGGTVIASYQWTGNLGTYESTTLAFNGVNGSLGANTVSVVVSAPNGQVDGNAANDLRDVQFTIFDPVGGPAVDESFASSAFPPSGWSALNGGSPAGWGYSSAGFNGAGSAKMNFVSSPAGDFDALVLPTMDLTGFDNAVLTFDLAAARFGSSNDNLKVKVSSNCGLTWTTLYNKTGAALATVGSQSSVFTPTSASQWRSESINLNNYLTRSALLVKFEALSNQGNNLYIDNINLNLTTGLTTLVRPADFSLSPNPAHSFAAVGFSIIKQQAVQLTVMDAQGRISYDVNESGLLPGDHQILIPVSDLAKGIYLVRLQGDETQQLRRLVVE